MQKVMEEQRQMLGPEERGAVWSGQGGSTPSARQCSFQQVRSPRAAPRLSETFPVRNMESSLESFRVPLL